ncbi:MAG: hypothetical protein QG649_184 [Patescibacteria group bacterium]|jgi:hypothetical protein|nr:hypothetical protein [Patescibacteria group bacterium]
MASSKSRRVQSALKNPMVQRFLIWFAPIALRFIVRQLRGNKANLSTRKYVKSKTK